MTRHALYDEPLRFGAEDERNEPPRRGHHQDRASAGGGQRRDLAWRLCTNAERFRLLVETAGNAILVLGRDFRILEFAGNAEQVYARLRHTVIGKNYLEALVPASARGDLAIRLRDVLDGARLRCLEHPIFDDDHGERILRWNASPVLATGGAVMGILAVASDVSAQKHAAQTQQRTNEAQARAAALEAMGTRASGIAHDFNNILTIIMSAVRQALDDPTLEATTRHALESVLPAVGRGESLVQDLFRVTHGMESQHCQVDLRAVVEDVINVMGPSIGSSVRIRRSFGAKTHMVDADRGEMHQIIMNLCMNAVRAMREGGGRLDIALDDVDVDTKLAATDDSLRPGPYVRLTVGDTGSGIDPGILREIFEPFFTTKRNRQGAGMGLAVVRSVTRAHGGAVTVESCTCQGSRFFVYLPRAESSNLARANPAGARDDGPARESGATPIDRARSHLATARALLRTRGARSASAITDALRHARDLVHEAGVEDLYEPFIRVEMAELARLTGDAVRHQRELSEARRLFMKLGASAHAERIARELDC